MSLTAAMDSQPKQALSVRLAATSDEVEQAFRLRYQVFVLEEKNPRLRRENGLEQDEFDIDCDHLIVSDETNGRVVGTYRLLPGERALAGRGFYSQTEFNLTAIADRLPRTLELGRSCIAADYRGGQAIQRLWEGIAAYISERNYDYLIGCASVHLDDRNAINEIYTLLRRKGVLTHRFGVTPLDSHRIQGLEMLPELDDEKTLFQRLPPLMKGYQWLGAEIAGDPAYDAVFDSVDFFILLDKSRVTRRYKRRFLNG